MRESLYDYCVCTDKPGLLAQWNAVGNAEVTPREEFGRDAF